MASQVTTSLNYPKQIDQCVKLNGEVFSSWSRLEKVKRDEYADGTHPYDLSAVAYNISKSRKSGIVYASDFGFDVPENAIITNIECYYKFCADDITKDKVHTNMVKLKVGASINDTGVGKYPVADVEWITHRYANRNGMQTQTISNGDKSVKDFWGVEITPSMVNSKNFGFLIQCQGGGSAKHKVYLDNMRVQISYKISERSNIIVAPPKKSNVTPKPVQPIPYHITTTLSAMKYDTLTPNQYIEQSVISQPYDSSKAFNFWIKHQNNAITRDNKLVIDNQQSKVFILETDGKLVFRGGGTSKVVNSVLVKGTSDVRYFKSDKYPLAPNYIEQFEPYSVYTNVYDYNLFDTTGKGFIESTVTLYSSKLVNGKYVKNSKISSITFKMTNNLSTISESKCVIENCRFINNVANKGAAIYNIGRLYTKNITLKNNTTEGQGKNNCQFYDVDICRDKEVL